MGMIRSLKEDSRKLKIVIGRLRLCQEKSQFKKKQTNKDNHKSTANAEAEATELMNISLVPFGTVSCSTRCCQKLAFYTLGFKLKKYIEARSEFSQNPKRGKKTKKIKKIKKKKQTIKQGGIVRHYQQTIYISSPCI